MAYPDEHIKQNDTSPKLERTYFTNRDIDSTGVTVSSVNVHMAERGGTTVSLDSTATLESEDYDADSITVSYDWQAGDTDTVGEYNVEFEITYSDGEVETFPKDGYIHLKISKEIA